MMKENIVIGTFIIVSKRKLIGFLHKICVTMNLNAVRKLHDCLHSLLVLLSRQKMGNETPLYNRKLRETPKVYSTAVLAQAKTQQVM